MEHPRTTIVVLNYNGRAWLRGCLRAATAQHGSYEVLVVDNGSEDGSIAAAAEWAGVRVLQLARNVGFAAGNNAGARAARATDYLVFLNNDTAVQAGWLEALVGALDDRPNAGMATSLIVRLDDPQIVDSAGDGYLRAGGAFKRSNGERRRPGEEVEHVFGACGAAFAIRKGLFEHLGGFDEDLFMVYEDVDLSYRVQLAGAACVYVPGAVVHHAGSATLGRESAVAVYYGQRNLEWVWLKNTPAALLWRDLPAHLGYSLAGCAYYSLRGRGLTCLRAKAAALRGLPSMWAKRRPGASPGDVRRIAGLTERRWWRVKWRERRLRWRRP